MKTFTLYTFRNVVYIWMDFKSRYFLQIKICHVFLKMEIHIAKYDYTVFMNNYHNELYKLIYAYDISS